MNCPLCDQTLVDHETLDPKTGEALKWKKCPVVINLVREYNSEDGKRTTKIYDVNHYLVGDRGEIAYVPPYRIHNVYEDNHCEVSECPLDRVSPPYKETWIIFKSPLIKIIEEDKLRQRIKNLIAFS